MPSTTDVIQVATGVASLAVSALALREARLQRVGRGEPGPPPPAPAPHLPVDAGALLPSEPVPPPVALPPAGPSPWPASAAESQEPPEAGPAQPPPGAPPEPPPVPAESPWEPPGQPVPAEPPAPARPTPPASGHAGYPAPPQGWSPPPDRPAAARSRGWLPWVAVVVVAAVLLGLGYVILALDQSPGGTAAPGGSEQARQGWPFVSVALLALTVVIALVVRRRRAPSRAAWVAVPAVLAAASVAVIVFALPVPAGVKLGAVLAALGAAAWAAFRR